MTTGNKRKPHNDTDGEDAAGLNDDLEPRLIEDYIGDGVYVVFDGYAITLDLRAQAAVVPVTKIMLEPLVFAGLVRFKERVDSMTREELEVGR